MAEPKPPSTTDLLLLIAGLQLLKAPDTSADFGEDYYLNEPTTTEERTLRESQSNQLWLRSPKTAWHSVKFRDWLIATLLANIAGHKNEFTAISEVFVVSVDLVTNLSFAGDVFGSDHFLDLIEHRIVVLKEKRQVAADMNAPQVFLRKHRLAERVTKDGA